MKELFPKKEVKIKELPLTLEKVKKFREADTPVTEEDLEEFAKRQHKNGK